MATLLLDNDIRSILKVQIEREPNSSQAKLIIKNDVKITGEIRERGRKLHRRTADVPDTANALFNEMIKHLTTSGFTCTNIERDNLPKMSHDRNDFSATAMINVGTQSDAELQNVFEGIFTEAVTDIAHSRYYRTIERWSDRVAGSAAHTTEL
jgi:hypothetical protein